MPYKELLQVFKEVCITVTKRARFAIAILDFQLQLQLYELFELQVSYLLDGIDSTPQDSCNVIFITD